MKLSIYSFLFEYYDIILDYSQVYVIILKLVWNYNVAFSFSSSNNSSNCLFLLLFMFNSSTSAINISSNSNSIDDIIVINIQRKISQSLLQFNTVDTCVGFYSLWLSKYVNVNSNMSLCANVFVFVNMFYCNQLLCFTT